MLSHTTLAAAAAAAIILVSVSISAVDAADCHSTKPNQTGQPNTHPIWQGTPSFVRSVVSGSGKAELYSVNGQSEDQIHLVHLYGDSAYDWGRAHGLLMKKEMEESIENFYNYLYTEIDQIVNSSTHPLHIFLSDKTIDMIASVGIDAVLDFQNLEAKPFMKQSFYDELRGMTDALNSTKYSFATVVRLYSIPELTRGRCSFIAATGMATAAGKTLQLRSLDWDMGTGLQQNPQVTIYHVPVGRTADLGYSFANIGWSGIIFTLSGMSSQGHGISEIGISYPDMPRIPGFPPSPPFGNETSSGTPFVWMERELIQFAQNLTDGVRMIKEANRTCRLILGMADATEKQGVMVQYAHTDPRFYYADSKEQAPPYAPWHPFVGEGLSFLAMDWQCPHFNGVMTTQLRKYYGRLTGQIIAQEVIPVVQTGDLHANIYDLSDGVLYTANAKAKGESGPAPAYMRQFSKIDVKASYNKKFGEHY